jgi:hypothetical protein
MGEREREGERKLLSMKYEGNGRQVAAKHARLINYLPRLALDGLSCQLESATLKK